MQEITREKGEGINIGNYIYIEVIDIRRDKVHLGIEAPKEIPIHREEVFENSIKYYLDSKKYQSAYNFLNSAPSFYRPSSDILSKLKAGLKKLGKLTKSIETKLQQYEEK